MALLFVLLWVIGGIPAAILGEVGRADNPRTVRAARIAFAFLLAVDLLLAAVIFSAGQDTPSAPMTLGLWWFTVIVAGVPLALFSGFVVRRGYRGRRRLALLVATLTTAALYLVFPLGFVPESRPQLTGLGRWAHEHYLLGIAVLLIPTLILLASELRWSLEVEPVPEPEPDRLSLRDRLAGLPRRNLVGVGVVLLALTWIVGTNGPGLVLGFGVIFAVIAVFLWQSHRSAMRGVRELRPPEKR